MPSFADDVRRFQAKTEAAMATVVRGTVIGIGGKLLQRSPVGHWDEWSDMGKSRNPRPPYQPGAFAGSWAYSFGAPTSAYTETIDVSGASSMARFREVSGWPVAGKHYLVHNSPYAGVMETGIHPTIANWQFTNSNHAQVTHLAAMDGKGIVAAIVSRLP